MKLSIRKDVRGNREIDYWGIKIVIQAADWKDFQKAVKKG